MIITLIVNTLAFLVIAAILPGFRIHSKAMTVLVALIYGVVQAVATWAFVIPVATALVALTAAIPPLGILAGLATLLAYPIIAFLISILALTITDKALRDFEIDSWATTFIAALLLAIINAITGAAFGL